MIWLLESRVLRVRVLVTPVLQCTSQMLLHWCHIRHSEVVSPSLGHFQTVFSEFKACVGNVMLLKRGQQVLLCRYPAYAQMVRVPRAALWILLCWSNDYWQKELCVKWYIKWEWEMKNQWSCWLAGWQRCLNSGALLKFISYRPTFRRSLHRCLNKMNSSNHQQPQLLLCHQGSILLQSLATWQFSGRLGQQGGLCCRLIFPRVLTSSIIHVHFASLVGSFWASQGSLRATVSSFPQTGKYLCDKKKLSWSPGCIWRGWWWNPD